ncbi:hypothetical protein PR048_022150 [Dryococelus australis]|uniref:G-protein coupled receptors family 1 profile domain-containing protein n=1 Tax=Dryococelus australis TaxID=614101 RepID=A0ABQ9H073_9NEOP|nr:hypothetical protein PR048_022150 [Dryococelus australis]
MMLLALTVERYVSVCHPGTTRPLMGPPSLTVVLIPVLTFLVYLPTAFRSELRHCVLFTGGYIYYRRSNTSFQQSSFYSVYKVLLEVVFKVGPTLLLAGLNMRIMVVYRRSCDRRRKMTICRSISSDAEDHRKFAEERRLILLLGSTSILFLVCISPMVILNVTLSEQNLNKYSYQVFRAVANLLEITNYSITFYIYCLFSEDFRNTLLRTFRWPWCKRKKPFLEAKAAGDRKPLASKPSSPPTTTTTNNTSGGTPAACLPGTPNGTAQKLWQRLAGCATVQDSCSYRPPERASV